MDRNETNVEEWQITETEEMILLRGPYQIFGSHNSAWLTWHFEKATNTLPRIQNSTDMTEGKSVLCLWDVFLWLVPNFAGIAAPLNKNLKNDQPFHFRRLNETEIEACETVEHRLLSPPKHTPERLKSGYLVDKDEFNERIGWVLLQEQSEVPASQWVLVEIAKQGWEGIQNKA